MLSEGFYVAAMQSCPCHSVSVDRQPNLVCAVMRRPIMQLFQARVGKYHRVVPEKVRFQARVVSFIWGRSRKATFSGTVGGNTMGSCPERFVFWSSGHLG